MMPKLSDTQAVLLAAAAARADLSVLPAPETLKLKGAALERTLQALRDRGLIAEAATTERGSDWTARMAKRGKRLVITPAGLDAIGVESQRCRRLSRDAPSEQRADPEPQGARPGGKLGRLLDAVSRPEGATLEDLSAAAGWLPHTTRAAITRLRQRGYDVRIATIGGAQGLSPGPGGLIDAELERDRRRGVARRLPRRWRRGSERCPACRSPSCGRPGPRPGAHRRRRERGGGC